MSDRESPKGFEGLSGMVSDGMVPAAETSASAKYQMISLTKNPSMAAPWSGDGPGEGWKWGDFYVTVQTNPETFFDFSAKMAGKKECWEDLSYHFSATVFRDPQKNEFGPSSRPVLVIAVEKSNFGTMVGVFDGDVRSNLGGYAGTLDVDSARATFFDFIGKRFALVGEPQRLGTIEAVREKVVTRKVGEIVGDGKSGSRTTGMVGNVRVLLPKGRTVPIAAALVVFVAWGFFAKPSFLGEIFGYSNFDECLLNRMKGQPPNLVSVARNACREAHPINFKVKDKTTFTDAEVFGPFAKFGLGKDFQVREAIEAGYSKWEIADYLLRSDGFTDSQISEVRKRGYSDEEIIEKQTGSKISSSIEGPRMAQKVQLPDGRIASFPADATQEQIESALRETFPQWGLKEQGEKNQSGSKDDPSKKNAVSTTSCEERATNKIGQPLTGAARNVFIKKCEKDRCEEQAVSAAGRPLAGAARKVSIEKCEKAR